MTTLRRYRRSVTFIKQDPNSLRYSQRLSKQQWDDLKPLVALRLFEGATVAGILRDLQIIGKPITRSQLDVQLKKWKRDPWISQDLVVKPNTAAAGSDDAIDEALPFAMDIDRGIAIDTVITSPSSMSPELVARQLPILHETRHKSLESRSNAVDIDLESSTGIINLNREHVVVLMKPPDDGNPYRKVGEEAGPYCHSVINPVPHGYGCGCEACVDRTRLVAPARKGGAMARASTIRTDSEAPRTFPNPGNPGTNALTASMAAVMSLSRSCTSSMSSGFRSFTALSARIQNGSVAHYPSLSPASSGYMTGNSVGMGGLYSDAVLHDSTIGDCVMEETGDANTQPRECDVDENFDRGFFGEGDLRSA